jgi:hypothetical protein
MTYDGHSLQSLARSPVCAIHHKCSVLLRTIAIYHPLIAQLNPRVLAHQLSPKPLESSRR